MQLGLENKIALVTGASGGIGFAISKSFYHEGASVIMSARNLRNLEEAGKKLDKGKGRLTSLPFDVTSEAEVKKASRFIQKEFGCLDILINCAGGAIRQARFEELSQKDFLDTYKLNVLGIFLTVKSFLPLLRKARDGRIINIASLAGIAPGFLNPHYASSKAAVINLSKYLSNYLAKEKILVNTVCPGPVHSKSWENYVRLFAKKNKLDYTTAWARVEKKESAKVPLGTIGEGEDVASIATFLCSDKAKWITGSCFRVDGGKVRTI